VTTNFLDIPIYCAAANLKKTATGRVQFYSLAV